MRANNEEEKKEEWKPPVDVLYHYNFHHPAKRFTGFAPRHLQLFVKTGLVFTPLHDEFFGSGAANLMLKCSKG